MFRYPYGDGTREDFEARFYIAQGFGNPVKNKNGRIIYYHEGADINLKTGGDTDLGEPIYACMDWKLAYYHLNSHNESGFGKHLVYEIDTFLGKRWLHHAHLQKPINPNRKSSGKIGDKLAEMDKTGRPRLALPAHDHFCVFKVDPAELPHGIDTIAKTRQQLNDWFEDPIEFLAKCYDYYMNTQPENTETVEQIIIDGYAELTDSQVTDDEKKWRLESWAGVKNFLGSLTGDARFFQKYVQPQLDSQKIVMENAYKAEKSQIIADWQSKLESAKKEYRDELKKKVEKWDAWLLITMGLKKLFKWG